MSAPPHDRPAPRTAQRPRGPGLSRRHFCAAVIASAVLPAAQADAPPVQVIDLDWTDGQRQRPLPVRLYRPLGQAHDTCGLVVFSHGIGGSRMGYSYLGRHWASQGMASLHLQHVGSDRQLWFGNPLALVGRLQSAARDDEAIARVFDMRHALDRVLEDGAAGLRVDPARIVAAGHSYGANTTLLAAGATVRRGDQLIQHRDARIRAAIVLSAPPFYGERDFRPILAGIRIPSLHITATDDVINIPGYHSPADDRVRVFDAIGSERKLLAMFAGGSHSIFTDRSASGGAELNPRVKRATQDLSWAFVRSVFDGDDEPLRAWPQQHGPLLARQVGLPA